MPVTTRRQRLGVALIELIAVIAILGLVGAMVGATIIGQQRFHRNAGAVLHARQGVRDALEVLSTDIRGASVEDTIRLMADSALELFTGIGTSVACRTIPASSIALPGESATGNTLTSFLLTPDTGDLALIYRRDSTAIDGYRWERHRIATLTTRLGNPDCLAEGVAPGEGFILTVQSPLEPAVEPGAPIRFVRRGRYSLYRSSDSRWYLGYRRCNAVGGAGCGAIQPISGPYRQYSADKARTGFLFEYFDARGELLSSPPPPLSIARVDVSARAEFERAPAGGSIDGVVAETSTGSIAIRNR